MRPMVRPHHTARPPLLAAASELLPPPLPRLLDARTRRSRVQARGDIGPCPLVALHGMPQRETSAGPLSEVGLCDPPEPTWCLKADPKMRRRHAPCSCRCRAVLRAARGARVALRQRSTQRALRSGSGLPLYSCTMAARAALYGSQQGEEGAGQPGLLGHVDADQAGCFGRAAGTPPASRDVRRSSFSVEFGSFLGQTRAREAVLASVCEGFRLGCASMRSDAERAGRPSAARGERSMPFSDDEWMRIAAAAATAAAREEELDDERERYFEGEAADSEHERDAHGARLSELHRQSWAVGPLKV